MPVSSLSRGVAVVASLNFSPEERAELKANLLKLTKAKVIVRSTERAPGGGIQYVEVDDNGIQLAATVKALEWDVGKPRQMLEVQSGPSAHRAATARDLGLLLASDPELITKVLGALKDGLDQAQAIPVQAVTSDTASPKSES